MWSPVAQADQWCLDSRAGFRPIPYYCRVGARPPPITGSGCPMPQTSNLQYASSNSLFEGVATSQEVQTLSGASPRLRQRISSGSTLPQQGGASDFAWASMHEDPSNMTLVSTVITLAHSLKLTVIAAGCDFKTYNAQPTVVRSTPRHLPFGTCPD